MIRLQEAELLSHFYVASEIAEATDGMLIALPDERRAEMEAISTDDFRYESTHRGLTTIMIVNHSPL